MTYSAKTPLKSLAARGSSIPNTASSGRKRELMVVPTACPVMLEFEEAIIMPENSCSGNHGFELKCGSKVMSLTVGANKAT